jgi:hypothetical protein
MATVSQLRAANGYTPVFPRSECGSIAFADGSTASHIPDQNPSANRITGY